MNMLIRSWQLRIRDSNFGAKNSTNGSLFMQKNVYLFMKILSVVKKQRVILLFPINGSFSIHKACILEEHCRNEGSLGMTILLNTFIPNAGHWRGMCNDYCSTSAILTLPIVKPSENFTIPKA